MSHSQFHRIEAYTEACTRQVEQAQQKLENDSWPRSVDLNADLGLTKCIFGVWKAPPFRASGEPLRASRKAAGKPPGKQLGSLQERLEAFGELLGTLRRLAVSRILACK